MLTPNTITRKALRETLCFLYILCFQSAITQGLKSHAKYGLGYSSLHKIYLKEWKLKSSHVNFPDLMAQNCPSKQEWQAQNRTQVQGNITIISQIMHGDPFTIKKKETNKRCFELKDESH